MNHIDRQNLRFLLLSDNETLKKWWEESSVEDHEYASELLKFHATELREQSRALLIEAELAKSDYSEARAVIRKFL